MAHLRPVLRPSAAMRRQRVAQMAAPFSAASRLANQDSQPPFPFPFPTPKPRQQQDQQRKQTSFSRLPSLPRSGRSALAFPDFKSLANGGSETLQKHPSISDVIQSERTKQPLPSFQSRLGQAFPSQYGLGHGFRPEPKLVIRATPETGRTIHVNPKQGVDRAFDILQSSVVGNKIPQISNLQRFHERPGLKRKRLRGVRWRQRFKKGFNATVTRVQQLVRQGW